MIDAVDFLYVRLQNDKRPDLSRQMVKDVLLQYYDSNSHNFGVEADVPDVGLVEQVVVVLPEGERRTIKAIKTYRACGGHTIRATWIKNWLRGNFPYHQLFIAKLTISEDGTIHTYSDIKPKE